MWPGVWISVCLCVCEGTISAVGKTCVFSQRRPGIFLRPFPYFRDSRHVMSSL